MLVLTEVLAVPVVPVEPVELVVPGELRVWLFWLAVTEEDERLLNFFLEANQ